MRVCVIFIYVSTSIEHTQSDYVLFEAASTLREAVVREWSILTLEHKNSLRHYLMTYIMQRPS